MKDFTKLRVWQEAHKLTIQIYMVTKKFSSDERYGLTSQLRRAASSIGSNLAEGCSRNSDKELVRFIFIAQAVPSRFAIKLFSPKTWVTYLQKNSAVLKIKISPSAEC